VTVLLTSHDLGDVEKVADRIGIIDRGRLVGLGSPVDLVADSTAIRFRLAMALGARDVTALEVAIGPLVDEGGARYRMDALPTPDTIAALAAWCAGHGALIVELRAGGGTLEERYLELVGRPGGAAAGTEPGATG
jgi:ABC-2 type transport system ATP-binding protein